MQQNFTLFKPNHAIVCVRNKCSNSKPISDSKGETVRGNHAKASPRYDRTFLLVDLPASFIFVAFRKYQISSNIASIMMQLNLRVM